MMPLITVCAIALLLILGAERLKPIVEVTQGFCVDHAGVGPHGIWRSALLCGTAVHSQAGFGELKQLGLIHLIVVSGAHLVFLENFLELILRPMATARRRNWIKALIFIYCFFAGLQAPLVRALFQRIGFTSRNIALIFSGILTALFFREVSLSLALSWAAALFVSWPLRLSPFTTSLVIALGLAPLLWNLSVPPLWAALLQPFFSLYFGGLIFPIAVASLFLPLEWIHARAWDSFFWILKTCTERMDLIPSFSARVSPFFLIIYLSLLQITFWRQEVLSRRQELWDAEEDECAF